MDQALKPVQQEVQEEGPQALSQVQFKGHQTQKVDHQVSGQELKEDHPVC